MASTRPSPTSPGAVPPVAAVRAAALAGGLLVAQQVAGKAARDAFFLAVFPVTALPSIDSAAALASLGAVVLFSRALVRLSPARLLPRALAASGVLFLAEWGLAAVAPAAAAIAVYVHMAVFGATLVSGFWALVTERFDPHAARHAMGAIGTGASVGGVLGGLLTWQVASLGATGMLPLLAAAAGLGALAIVGVERTGAAAVRPKGEPDPVEPGLGPLLRVPYLRNLGLLVLLCAFLETLLNYTYKAAANAELGSGPPLLSFFALFHSATGVLALAVQWAAAPRALARLGIGGTVGAHAGLVAAFAAAAAALPRFAVVVAARGAEAVLRGSLFRSGYELLYTPLPPARKRAAKPVIDVGLDRVGTLVGSGAIALLLASGVPPLRLLFAAAAVAAAGMLVVAVGFHRAYVGALVESLRAGVVRLEADDVKDAATRRALDAAAPPPSLAAAPAAPPEGERVRALRAGDPARVREALVEGDLDPLLVATAMPLLARDDLFPDVLTALRKVGAQCTGQLVDALLDEGGDPVVRRRVARVLAAVPTQRAADGLLAALAGGRFDVRYRSAQALVRQRTRNPRLAMPRDLVLDAARREVEGGTAWAGGDAHRALEHVFAILSLVMEGEPLGIALRAMGGDDDALRGTALEYLDNVLPAEVRDPLWPRLGAVRPARSGRSTAEMRDELLRSSSQWTLGTRRPRSGAARR